MMELFSMLADQPGSGYENKLPAALFEQKWVLTSSVHSVVHTSCIRVKDYSFNNTKIFHTWRSDTEFSCCDGVIGVHINQVF